MTTEDRAGAAYWSGTYRGVDLPPRLTPRSVLGELCQPTAWKVRRGSH
jgi:hypothetical protein